MRAAFLGLQGWHCMVSTIYPACLAATAGRHFRQQTADWLTFSFSEADLQTLLCRSYLISTMWTTAGRLTTQSSWL